MILRIWTMDSLALRGVAMVYVTYFPDLAVPGAPEAVFAAGLAQAGLSANEAWLVRYLFTEVLDGRNESLTDGVQRALGREPRDFHDYAREAAASGAWNA